MKRIISLFSLFILLFVNIVTPVTYAMDGEDSSSESVSESTESSVDTDNSVGGGDDSSDTDASDDVASDEGTEPDADSESAEDTDADVTDEESSDEEGPDSTEGEEVEESLENSASGSTDGDTSEEEVSAEEEIELLCKQEGAPENAHYLSSDDDASDVSCKWECDSNYALSEDGLSCVLVEESSESVVTDSKGNSEEVKSCEIPENAQKIETTEEKCEWECSQGYLITKAGDTCEEINFSKYKNEPSVDALCYKLGLSWAEEKGDLAKLAGIDDYVGSREQNESIRLFLVDHVEEILKGKFDKNAELISKIEKESIVSEDGTVYNSEVIKGKATYNDITVNVVAPIGSFPEGTRVNIETIEDNKEIEAKEDALVNKMDEVKKEKTFSFDISFYAKDDVNKEHELQPRDGKEVSVVFDYAANEEIKKAIEEDNTKISVYHLEEKDTNNKVHAEELQVKTIEELKENVSVEHKEVIEGLASEDTVGVVAKDFSVYILTLVTTANNTAKLWLYANGGSLTDNTFEYSSIVSDTLGDEIYIKTLTGQISRDVVMPNIVKNDFTFLGWYNGEIRIGEGGDIIRLSSGDNTTLHAKWQEGQAEAVIGAHGYTTFIDAINAADNGDIITLLTGVTLSTMFNLEKDVIINLNGHKLSRNDGNSVVQVTNDAHLTIDGTKEGGEVYGRINIGKATNNNGNVTLSGGYYHCTNDQTVLHVNGTCRNSNVTIKNAKIYSPSDNGIQLNGAGEFLIKDSILTGKTAVYIKAGNLTIQGSTLASNAIAHTAYSYNGNGSNPTGDGLVVDTCLYPGGAPKVTLGAGNQITVASETNKQLGYYEYNTTSPTFESATIKATSSDNSVTDGFIWEKQGVDLYKLVPIASYVAAIGDSYYTSLEDAVTNATGGDTIKVLTGIVLSNHIDIEKTITLDLNGYSITPNDLYVGGDYLIGVKRGANLTINDSSTGKTGKIDVLGKTNINTAIKMTLKGEIANGDPAQLNINGGTFIGYYYAVSGNGNRNNTIVNIETGSFSAVAPGSLAIYHPQDGILTINNGTFEGYSTAIEIRAGTLIINGGTFTSTANSFSCNPNASGTTTVGAAVAIAQHTTKQNLTGVINGGIFNGKVAINVGNPQGNNGPTPNLIITNGVFNGAEKDVDVQNGEYVQHVKKFISGGTFTYKVPEEFSAEGYLPTEVNAQGKYTVTPEYTYKFDVDGVIISSGNVVSGATITGVIPEVNKQGFTFNGWTLNGNDVAFPLTVTGNITLIAKWTANTNTPYKYHYLKQNIDGTWSEKIYGPEGLSGITGEPITISEDLITKFEGFTLSGTIADYTGIIIKADGSTDVEIKYKRNSHNVKYVYANSDSLSSTPSALPETKSYKYGESVTIAAPATATGYTFSWNARNFTMPDEDVVITGTFASGTADYMIKYYFQNENNEYVQDKNIEKAKKLNGTTDSIVSINDNEIKSYSGFTYSGDISFPTGKITGDGKLVLRLRYDRNNYKLHFDPNGGIGVIEDQIKPYESGWNQPNVITKTGYVFGGWCISGTENVFDFNTTVKEDVNLVAKWNPAAGITYKVINYYERTDGSYKTGENTYEGSTDDYVEAPIITNSNIYTFDGDKEDNVLTGYIKGDNSLVLKVYYKRNIYTITFDPNGGSEVEALTGRYNYKFTAEEIPENPTKTGYSFVGWYSGDTQIDLTGHKITSNLDLIAKWTANTNTPYKYHYLKQNIDGTWSEKIYGPEGLSGITGEPITISEDLITKFEGFTLSGTIADYTGIIIKADGSTDVEIKYKRNSHNVKYVYANSDSLSSTPSALPKIKSYKYGEPVTIADDATATGYTFSWNARNFTMPDEDVIITGTFASGTAEYIVSYYYQDANGGYSVASGSVVRTGTTDTLTGVLDSDKISENPSYEFTESGSVLTGMISGDGSLELKIYFKGVYTVTYQAGTEGGFSDKVFTGYEYGTKTPTLPEAVNEYMHTLGYIFDRWSPKWSPLVTGNVTYVAQWVPIQTTYNVEYYQENLSGEFKKVETVELSGATNSLVEAEKKSYEGFTFSGDLEETIISGNVKGDGSLVLKLFYTRDAHILTYTDPDGNQINKTVKYGEDISIEPSTYDGYKFGGFAGDIPLTMPDNDLNVTPIWNLKQYKVSFETDGGDPIEPQTYTIESGIDSLPTPVWTGYEFTGWYDGDTKVTAITTGSTGNITLTAHWDARVVDYTVTHYKEAWKGYKKNNKVAKQASDGKWYYEEKVKHYSGHVDSIVDPTDDIVKPITSFSGFTYDEDAPNVRSGTITATGLELRLYYKRNKYTVTFDSDGGSAVTGQDVGFYLTPEKPKNPTKEGYEFSGWTLSGDAYSFKTGYVRNNIELKAEWTPNKYIVIYDANGASGSDYQVTYNYDQLFEIYNPTDYSLTGHDFIGWSRTSTGDVEYTGGQTVSKLATTGDVTLYAVWKAKKYKITFVDEDGTTVIGEFTGAYGEDPKSFWKKDPIQQKDNWKCKFKKWSPDPVAITGEATYKATYYPMGSDPDICSFSYYTVTFVNEDGSDLQKDGHIGYGSKVKYTGATPEKAADEQYSYVFSGWNPELISGAIVTGDMVYTAVYTPVLRQYNVTWTNWDGSEIKVDTGIVYGTVPEFSGTTPTRPADEVNAYEFSGWLPTIKAITGDITYTADFKKVNRGYTIIWSGNNDNNQTNKEVIQYWQQDVQVQPDPVKTGYVFAGWNPKVIPGTTRVTGDETYVAQWAPATNTPYKVEHYIENLDGIGFNLAETDNLTGTTDAPTEAVEKALTGFSLSGEIVQKTIAADGKTVVRVEYSRNSYKLKYNSKFAQPKTQMVRYGAEIPLPESTNRTGWVFSGLAAGTPATMPAEELTVNLSWNPAEDTPYKVEHYLENLDGTGFDLKEIEDLTGTTNEKTTAAAKAYSGFALSGSIKQQRISATGDTVIKVEYKRNSYKLTYNSKFAQPKTQMVRYGAEIPLPESTNRTGHVFSGLAAGTPATMPATGLIVNLSWNKEIYDVNFDTDGGSLISGQNVEYEKKAEIPDEPTKTGYQFSGWTLNGETFDFTETKITGDITLTGAWTPVTYDIDYLPNGGVIKSGNATTYTIEDEVQLYNTAIRTGYVFKGWLDASSGVVDRIEKGTYGNQILLAQWQQVSAALAEAKSGEKKAVVSSDVTVDVDAAPGTAEYTGNIPAGTPSFVTPLLTNVVNSGTIEEYSLVGIERSSTQLDVKTDELQVKTGYVATIVGGLEVYLKKITITKNASGVIETKTEKNTNTVNFSKPVALPINITTSATGVKVMVNHGEGYGLSGLSINPNTTCTNGIASDPYTGELIPVENSYAWIYTCSASKFLAYTETVKSSGGGSSGGSSSGGSGGGGGGSSKSSSSSSSSSTTPTTNTGNTTNIDLKGVVSAPNKACLNITEESKIKYSDEVLDAYAWAYANGVVTSNDVEKARVYSYITRAELAKIMVQYVAGVLKKKPVVEGNVSYADVDESLGEYAGYINLAYQYQIMGINADGTPLKEFGPKSLVTRAEFASVLSRVLYGDKYNVDGSQYYSMHIDVLDQAGIITDTNPSILERIGWILIMLKRASKDIPNSKDASNVEYCPITSEDEQKAAYEWALKYGITSIDDPDKARLGEELTRAEFAKMMVQYMINVLHKKPILNKDISYPDVDGSLGDLEAYIKLAYQYQIMGIHGNGQPLEEFAPNRIVTRKEFATVFSRILFGDRFNIDGPEYWTNHIDALKEISVLKDGNPALQEVRGRVMLMMYRSADDLNK